MYTRATQFRNGHCVAVTHADLARHGPEGRPSPPPEQLCPCHAVDAARPDGCHSHEKSQTHQVIPYLQSTSHDEQVESRSGPASGHEGYGRRSTAADTPKHCCQCQALTQELTIRGMAARSSNGSTHSTMSFFQSFSAAICASVTACGLRCGCCMCLALWLPCTESGD